MRYLRILLAATISLVLFSNSLIAQGKSVKIIFIRGEIKVLKKDTTDWVKAMEGMKLFTGDRIKSSADSQAEIAFDKKNVVAINENTDVYIRLKENERIELIEGEIFSLVQKIPKGESFEIRTPVAVCGARGTGWGTTHIGFTIMRAFDKASYIKWIDKDGIVVDKEYWIDQGFERAVKKFTPPSVQQKIADTCCSNWSRWKDEREWRRSHLYIRKQALLQSSLERALERKESLFDKSDRGRIEEKKDERREGSSEGDSKTSER